MDTKCIIVQISMRYITNAIHEKINEEKYKSRLVRQRNKTEGNYKLIDVFSNRHMKLASNWYMANIL